MRDFKSLSHFMEAYFIICILSEGGFISFLILQFHLMYKIQIRKGKKNLNNCFKRNLTIFPKFT